MAQKSDVSDDGLSVCVVVVPGVPDVPAPPPVAAVTVVVTVVEHAPSPVQVLFVIVVVLDPSELVDVLLLDVVTGGVVAPGVPLGTQTTCPDAHVIAPSPGAQGGGVEVAGVETAGGADELPVQVLAAPPAPFTYA